MESITDLTEKLNTFLTSIGDPGTFDASFDELIAAINDALAVGGTASLVTEAVSAAFGYDPTVRNIIKLYVAGDKSQISKLRDHLRISFDVENFSDVGEIGACSLSFYPTVETVGAIDTTNPTRPTDDRMGVANKDRNYLKDASGVVLDTIAKKEDESLTSEKFIEEPIKINKLNMSELNKQLSNLPKQIQFSIVNSIANRFGNDVAYIMQSALQEGRRMNFSAEVKAEVEKLVKEYSSEPDTTNMAAITIDDGEPESIIDTIADLPTNYAASVVADIELNSNCGKTIAEKLANAIVTNMSQLPDDIKNKEEDIKNVVMASTKSTIVPEEFSLRKARSYSKYLRVFSELPDLDEMKDTIDSSINGEEVATSDEEPETTEASDDTVGAPESDDQLKVLDGEKPPVGDDDSEPPVVEAQEPEEPETGVQKVAKKIAKLDEEDKDEVLLNMEDKISSKAAAEVRKEAENTDEEFDLSDEEIQQSENFIKKTKSGKKLEKEEKEEDEECTCGKCDECKAKAKDECDCGECEECKEKAEAEDADSESPAKGKDKDAPKSKPESEEDDEEDEKDSESESEDEDSDDGDEESSDEDEEETEDEDEDKPQKKDFSSRNWRRFRSRLARSRLSRNFAKKAADDTDIESYADQYCARKPEVKKEDFIDLLRAKAKCEKSGSDKDCQSYKKLKEKFNMKYGYTPKDGWVGKEKTKNFSRAFNFTQALDDLTPEKASEVLTIVGSKCGNEVADAILIMSLTNGGSGKNFSDCEAECLPCDCDSEEVKDTLVETIDEVSDSEEPQEFSGIDKIRYLKNLALFSCALFSDEADAAEADIDDAVEELDDAPDADDISDAISDLEDAEKELDNAEFGYRRRRYGRSRRSRFGGRRGGSFRMFAEDDEEADDAEESPKEEKVEEDVEVDDADTDEPILSEKTKVTAEEKAPRAAEGDEEEFGCHAEKESPAEMKAKKLHNFYSTKFEGEGDALDAGQIVDDGDNADYVEDTTAMPEVPYVADEDDEDALPLPEGDYVDDEGDPADPDEAPVFDEEIDDIYDDAEPMVITDEDIQINYAKTSNKAERSTARNFAASRRARRTLGSSSQEARLAMYKKIIGG